ncbi:BTB/POZ and MATH domain-containing protein 3 isoform X2 [Tanacetum coccineum]
MSMTIDGFHLFDVKEYSRLKRKDAESFVSSEPFTVGGYDWAIYFYPHGKRLTNTRYVSVYFGLANEAPNVKASCELTLLDQSGKGIHHVKSISNKDYNGERVRYV